jgi:hypothetical protein
MIDSIFMTTRASYICDNEKSYSVSHITESAANQDVWDIATALNNLQTSPLTKLTRTNDYIVVDLG